jgi:AhpC/TSA antioxidant enzyme
LREDENRFKERGAGIAAIGLGDRNYARMFREDTAIDFPLLIDEERAAYRAVGLREANIFHLFRGENAAARKRARAGGFKQHKLGKNPFQLGGSFVFAPGDVDLFAHVSATFGGNAKMEDLLAAIK